MHTFRYFHVHSHNPHGIPFHSVAESQKCSSLWYADWKSHVELIRTTGGLLHIPHWWKNTNKMNARKSIAPWRLCFCLTSQPLSPLWLTVILRFLLPNLNYHKTVLMVHPYTFLATSFKVPNSTFLQLCAMHVQFNLLSKEKSLISLFLSESSPLIFFILWYNAQVWSHSWSYLRLASS